MTDRSRRDAGFRTNIAPNLIVPDGVKAIEFYQSAFNAVVLHQVGDDAGVAQLSVDGAEFWIAAGESAELGRFTFATLGGRSVSMILTVEDPDGVWNQAVGAGATIESAPYDSHGWRIGSVIDPFGHRWEIAAPLGQWPPP
jgi:PhnB protein